MECNTYLRNVTDLLSGGKTPCERRFGMPFTVIPFGAMVEYRPYLCEGHGAGTSIWSKGLAGKIPRLCFVRGGNLEGRHYDRRHWRIGGDGCIRNPRQKAQCKGSVNVDEKWQFFPSRRWNSQNPWRRSTSEDIHFNPGSSWTRRRTRSFSRRIRRTLFSRPSSRWLNTGRCGSQKWFLVCYERFHISSSRGTQSQTVHAERRIFLLLRWSASTLTEQHIRHLMYSVKNRWMIAATWMEKENYLMHGQDSQDLFYWAKGHLTDIHGPGGDWRGNKQPEDPTMYDRICGSICSMKRKAKQNENGLSRNQSSIMSDSYVVSSSLNLRMKKSDTSSKMFVESLKFRRLQQRLVKHQWMAAGKPATELGKTCRRNYEDKIGRCATQVSRRSHVCKRNKVTESLLFGAQVFSNVSSIEKFWMRRKRWKIMGKLEKMPAWQLTKVRNKKWSMMQGVRGEKFISRHWWISVISRIRSLNIKSTKAESYSEVTRWRMIQEHKQCLLNKDHKHHKWLQQRSWISFPDYQDARSKQQMQYQLTPRSKWKMHHRYWKF